MTLQNRSNSIPDLIEDFVPVMLSGGSGTRLWPLSRSEFPKQFCPLFTEPLFTLTLRRILRLGQLWIVTTSALKALTQSALRSSQLHDKIDTCLYEPRANNTLPAIMLLLRCLQLAGKAKGTVGIFPADQLIQNEARFYQAVSTACAAAKNGKVVTLGIEPTEANTGYGYIQLAEATKNNGAAAVDVKGFHEKPNLQTAQMFLESGEYAWNAGIFIFSGEHLIPTIADLHPQLWALLTAWNGQSEELPKLYDQLPKISFDYGVMEKIPLTQIACVPVAMGWSDIGSWDSAFQNGVGAARKPVEVSASGNSIFSAHEDKTYATIEVDNLEIIDTEDALLVLRRGSSQKVREVVDRLSASRPEVVRTHPNEFRPWGDFSVLKNTVDFKSKLIRVNPGQRLSLQSHQQREEHWLIVKGQGVVTINAEEILVSKGKYVHIPVQAKHRIQNTGTEILEFVEVQLGTYFGEDDIMRYADDYQRTERNF